MWEQPDVVDKFSDRKVDHRLEKFCETIDVGQLSILDIGCAAGRNSVWLAQRQATVYALDSSSAMVQRTRERLTPFVTNPSSQVLLGSMSDLSPFEDKSFDMVLAFGIFQEARTYAEWQQALSETARVLKEGGHCFVANFSPDSQPQGVALKQVAEHSYEGFSSQEKSMILLKTKVLDSEFAAVGLMPVVASEAVKAATEQGFRITVNALYKKKT